MKMHTMQRAPRRRGFTLIELLVVGVVVAILLTVAVAGFGGMFARKRVEGAAADFLTDLQQARTEAVTRNVPVRLTFGTGCHVLHANDVAITCNGAAATPANSPALIRIVERVANDTTFAVQPTATPPASIEFDSRNGVASTDPAGIADPGVLFGSNAGTWQLRVRVGAMGRVEICSPGSSLSGYAAC